MIRKTQPARDALFRLAPGEIRPYWRDSIGGSSKGRAAIFAAAREAADAGHVSLHLRRVHDACEWVAMGRVR